MITNSYAQTIPNNGFEDWTGMGAYKNPDSRTSLNDMTAHMSTYTCVKGTPGPVGTTNEIDFNILQLNVIAQTINPVTTIPTSFVTVTLWLQSNVTKNWRRNNN